MLNQWKFLNKYLKRKKTQCFKLTDLQASYQLLQTCQVNIFSLREFFISLFVKNHLKNSNLTQIRDRMYRKQITNSKANDTE